MAVTWKKSTFLGVRYREHKTRKHGGNRPDKCFSIRYKLNGVDKEESVGWSSEGVTAEKAFKLLSQVRENIRTGHGPCTLADLKAANEQKQLMEKKAVMQLEEKRVTFEHFWASDYLPYIKTTKKAGTIQSEQWLFSKWIQPALGNITFQELSVRQLDALVNTAKRAGKSAATIRYILAVISQIWNKAVQLDIVSGDCPCRKIKKPRQDNRRIRFLTQGEADKLLAELSLRSRDMHDIAMLSLYTGMRAGEIHALQWGNVDFQDDSIKILDPKNGRNRMAFMTPEVKSMLQARYNEQPKGVLVFPGRNGQKRRWVSDTFDRVVTSLGFNNSGEYSEHEGGIILPEQITDARQKVVFHTLRHTFASWLVQRGVPLYTVAELMGHSTIDMTQRYSHLAPDSLRNAAMTLGGILS